MHLLKDDYGKIFESLEIDETIKGHFQHYIFLKTYLKKYGNTKHISEELKKFIEKLDLQIKQVFNIFLERVETIMMPEIQMENLMAEPIPIKGTPKLNFIYHETCELFESLNDVELSKLLLKDLREQKIQKEDLLSQFTDYKIIIQTSNETLFPIKLKSANSFFSLTMTK